MSGTGFKTTRIGAVSYLNSRPLIEGLSRLAPEAELVLDYPSGLADQLADGNLDVALVPSIEYFREPDFEVISNACVAACGPVMSVKLYFRVRPGMVRSLAMDEGSRTSAALARIMLAERYGVDPELETLSLHQTIEQTRADAVLLIGDRAMFPPGEPFYETWDLGQQWFDWTGLPFVFAMWVARREFESASVERALGCARDRGAAQLEYIAHREAPLLGIDEATAFGYLRDNLNFTLGAAERHGLRLFYQLAEQQGLVPEGAELVFRNDVTGVPVR